MPSTSLLRIGLLTERKDKLQISDFVSDNYDDSIKYPNYESDSTSSSLSSSSISSDNSNSSSSYSPGYNGFLSNSHNVRCGLSTRKYNISKHSSTRR
ncbi:unnamed protein product [Diabrotica balteata]|uniref:Uncharacterized protein n=1 Tax=Diabrotica balteata TaxID=107213 RepID=A0A9N9T646_DIABA|nr:unnamed protein product [Diabrotica balteata]